MGRPGFEELAKSDKTQRCMIISITGLEDSCELGGNSLQRGREEKTAAFHLLSGSRLVFWVETPGH